MAVRRERVRLECDGRGEISLVDGMRHSRNAARTLAAMLASYEATWEPHDWRDFD